MISGPIPSPGISVAGIDCGIGYGSHVRGAKRISILELRGIHCGSEGETALDSDEEIIAATRRWLERAVIGLNLCPFAEGVYRGGRVRFRVSDQKSAAGFCKNCVQRIEFLHGAIRAVARRRC
jgi:hypothetical protein